MKFFASLVFVCAVTACCWSGVVVTPVNETPDQVTPREQKEERPSVNLPTELRQRNWIGTQGNGSCVHATMISLLRWQGRTNTAEYWKRAYSSGETANGLQSKFDREGIRYAYTVDADVKFLEWACSTRRGCGVTVMGGVHMVALVHLDSKWACILDNNSVEQYKWVPRETFLAEWRASNGWAVTIVYTPTPPLPW
jgi:hypothetical protein